MDRREEKSIERVLYAFEMLVGERGYSQVTVSNLIDASRVSRSTFYAHFKKKEDVLLLVADRIFDHVFRSVPVKQKDKRLPPPKRDPREDVRHLFYHLYEDRDLISVILSSEGKGLFLDRFRFRSLPLCAQLVSEGFIGREGVPDFQLVQLTNGALGNLVEYWIGNGCEESAEKEAEVFFRFCM